MVLSLRIAVADDHPDMREYYQEVLPRLGHRVVVAASNGCELVEQCQTAEPDLIISDINMPEMDGVTAVATLCRERRIPVIFVSANQHWDLSVCAELGVVLGRVDKPIKLSELQLMIARALSYVEPEGKAV
ncbi:MAG TPA: response regulator [Gemmataceae bacterium]|nr:response regulator [Gemmataceae bacterium]